MIHEFQPLTNDPTATTTSTTAAALSSAGSSRRTAGGRRRREPYASKGADVSQGTPDDACPIGNGAGLALPHVWDFDAGEGTGGLFHPVETKAKAASLMAACADPWEVANALTLNTSVPSILASVLVWRESGLFSDSNLFLVRLRLPGLGSWRCVLLVSFLVILVFRGLSGFLGVLMPACKFHHAMRK